MLSRIWGSSAPPAGSLAAMSISERSTRMLNANVGLSAIMDDDMAKATTVLNQHEDGFHLTGRGIAAFLEAMLGGERTGIQTAGILLNDAHTSLDAELGHAKAEPDSVFPVGSVYKVILANVLLMSAITGFLSETMTEAMKAVWKLKRAYGIFDGMHTHIQTHALAEHFSNAAEPDANNIAYLDYQTYCSAVAGYGMQTLVISLLPPKLGRILSLVGFKGSRAQGLAALWSIAESPTIPGALSLLGILLYYNGLLHFCDIVPDAQQDMQRCATLLEQARARYPHSAIWQLQVARLKLQQAKLAEGTKVLEDISMDSQMKQIANLKLYDLGLSQIFGMRWSDAIETYVLVGAQSTWSESAYAYIIFICLHQQWAATQDEAIAAKATKALTTAQATGGHKKMLGKPIPLEMLVLRKHARWLAISQEKGCSLIEAVDGCPAAEFVHLFNGWRSMPSDVLEQWLQLLPSPTGRMDSDAVVRVIRTAILRNLGRLSEAQEALNPTLFISKQEFKDFQHSELWIMPFAYYERACIFWARDGKSGKEDIRHWVQRARSFGDTEMESRLDIRLTTALNTIDGET